MSKEAHRNLAIRWGMIRALYTAPERNGGARIARVAGMVAIAAVLLAFLLVPYSLKLNSPMAVKQDQSSQKQEWPMPIQSFDVSPRQTREDPQRTPKTARPPLPPVVGKSPMPQSVPELGEEAQQRWLWETQRRELEARRGLAVGAKEQEERLKAEQAKAKAERQQELEAERQREQARLEKEKLWREQMARWEELEAKAAKAAEQKMAEEETRQRAVRSQRDSFLVLSFLLLLSVALAGIRLLQKSMQKKKRALKQQVAVPAWQQQMAAEIEAEVLRRAT